MSKYILTFILMGVMICSCSSELDLYPYNGVSPDDIQESDLSVLRVGMYNQVQNDPKREAFIMNDILGGLLTSSNGLPKLLINNTLSPLNGTIQGSWTGYFAALYQVNNVLQVTKNFSDSDLKNKTRGEAYFFRAWIYSKLVTSWGDVPILRENTMEKVSRDPIQQVWAFIEEDLQNAEDLLNNTNDSYYYVSQNAVVGLKARIKLYQGKKAEAAELAEQIITQTNHKLDGFQKIFRNQQNDEIIFAFENRSTESNITISTLFYSYAHSNKGSWVYRPYKEVLDLYTNDDLRKDISWITIDGNDMINKYPSGQTGTDPVVILRLAEMYLISAEAQGVSKGLARLNQLRNKRGLDNISPSGEEEFIDAILLERKKEFLGENFLFYDLVRTGRAMEELGILDYQQLLPIPGKELLLNDKLTPNPGY